MRGMGEILVGTGRGRTSHWSTPVCSIAFLAICPSAVLVQCQVPTAAPEEQTIGAERGLEKDGNPVTRDAKTPR